MRVLGLIHGICKADGIAAVVSLHQVALARRFADRVIGLSGGRVLFDGVPEALDGAALARIYGPGAHLDEHETVNPPPPLSQPAAVAA